MSFTVNNSANGNGGSTSQSVTISIAAGHTVACVWGFNTFGNGGAISGITDSSGNTYALGNSANDSAFGGTNSVGAASFIGLPTAITSVTFNTAGNVGGGFCWLWVWDISGTGTITLAATLATSVDPSPSSTNGVTTGSLTITSSDGLILGAAVNTNSQSVVIGTGFTADATGLNSSPSEHKAVTSSAAVTFTCASGTGTALTVGLAFQISSASGVSVAWWT